MMMYAVDPSGVLRGLEDGGSEDDEDDFEVEGDDDGTRPEAAEEPPRGGLEGASSPSSGTSEDL
jgi:hypothetical protein